MRKDNCDLIRRELDDLMLDEACSASAAAHLKECAACREFQQTQTKLRRMVGGLGTVAAPADFDFRLRARLANDVTSSTIHYWPLVQRGFAVAAVLLVFGFGVVVVRNIVNQREATVAEKNPPVQPSPKPPEITQPNAPVRSEVVTAHVPPSNPDRAKNERPVQAAAQKIKRPLTAIDFSKQRAEVISGSEAFTSDAAIVFPIDASLQPLRFSLDDGRGNAKTISVPTIRFGSQRMLPRGSQLAEKGIW